MCIIEAKNIYKYYSKLPSLKDISLEVNKGEILGLIGPSGSGKTTLLKCLIGLEKITEGTIYILNSKIPNLLILDKIGYMPQADELYPELTGREHLNFYGRVYKIKEALIEERIIYFSEFLELEELLDVQVNIYSSEMKKKLSFALALIQNPELLILDEPTINISPMLSIAIWRELKKLKSQGKTILITTNLNEDADNCDRLAILKDGEVVALGPLDVIKKNYSELTC